MSRTVYGQNDSSAAPKKSTVGGGGGIFTTTAMERRTVSLRRHLFHLGLLIVCPLLVVGFVLSALYVREEQKSLHNEAISTVHDAATTIDHELRRDLLALQIISTSVDLTNSNF